jgi:hypothetical protein
LGYPFLVLGEFDRERVVDATDGALVLAATEPLLDPTNPEQVVRSRTLLEELSLRDAQERFQYDV